MTDTVDCTGLPCQSKRGTYAGYIQILKHNKGKPKEEQHPKCEACKQAGREYSKQRIAARKAKAEAAPEAAEPATEPAPEPPATEPAPEVAPEPPAAEPATEPATEPPPAPEPAPQPPDPDPIGNNLNRANAFKGNQHNDARRWVTGEFPDPDPDMWVHTLDQLSDGDNTFGCYLVGMDNGRLQVADLPSENKPEGFVNKVGDEFYDWLDEQQINFESASMTCVGTHTKFATALKILEIEEFGA